MKNKNVRGILALIIVTALSFGVIAGSKALAKDQSADQGQDKAQITEELDVTGTENIQSAARTEDGYLVTVTEAGYSGDIVLEVSFGEDKATVTNVAVTEQNETEGVGSKITEEEFLSQFAGAKAPVYLPGMTLEEDTASAQAEDLELQDGTYDELSENGQYVMTEDGPTWAEQSKALGAALVENQNLDFLTTDNQGKTDAVSGVSISVGGFVKLAQQCIDQAGGMESQGGSEGTQEGTEVDGVSGATISSTAAVKGINAAYEFLQTID